MLYGLLDIVQGSGRGSHSGQPSVTVLVTNSKTPYKQYKWQSVDYALEKELYELVTPNICWQGYISLQMDNNQINCRDIPNAQMCDICDPQSQTNLLVLGKLGM